ncbi:D-alanine--D-alanine ligase family protein [candidate division KSB1 bacterium]
MNRPKKIRLGLIFGGRSSEHEVSVTSARSMMEVIDPEKYDIQLVGITPEGRWVAGANARRLLEGKKAGPGETALLPQYPGNNRLVLENMPERTAAGSTIEIDVFFPLLHGTYGEDGTIQGLLELTGIPFVGAGVAASAVGMDKIMMKDIFRARGLPALEYLFFLRSEWRMGQGKILDMVENTFPYPVFVKPANTGSSVGISKANNRDELISAVMYAAEFDRKVLIEPGLDVREIECSVLGNDKPEASVPGEIVPSGEFYDYEAKYVDERSKLIIPAEIPDQQEEEIRDLAVRAFTALDCAGMARVDFFIDRISGVVYINEVNTIPGFTPISMYPKLWEASGISYTALIDRLVELAFERHKDRLKSSTTYLPKK